MGKLLLMVALAFALVAVLRVFASHRRKPSPRTEKTNPQNQVKQTPVETLLPCPQCGVHFAASELASHQKLTH
jgi:cytochrome c-type biogenesis protein CcmH/NrfF